MNNGVWENKSSKGALQYTTSDGSKVVFDSKDLDRLAESITQNKLETENEISGINNSLDGLRFRDNEGVGQYSVDNGGSWRNFRQPTGNATASQVLSGYTFANADSDSLTGSMTNQGTKTASLYSGQSYTIPAGYHNGSGKVTANNTYYNCLFSWDGTCSARTKTIKVTVAGNYYVFVTINSGNPHLFYLYQGSDLIYGGGNAWWNGIRYNVPANTEFKLTATCSGYILGAFRIN